MSNYSIQASPGWDVRDGLTTGATGKTISATEFNTEFTAIATAVNSKADLASPELTGTPKATTASSGTNTDQIATTQYVQTEITGHDTKANILLEVYPVGSVYTSVASTDPSTLFGGTWSSFGAGKVMVGIDSSDEDFDTVEETGGAKTHTLTTDELPEHKHASNIRVGAGSQTLADSNLATTVSNGDQLDHETTHTTASTDTGPVGGDTAHNNLQPYIVVYMWKRTA